MRLFSPSENVCSKIRIIQYSNLLRTAMIFVIMFLWFCILLLVHVEPMTRFNYNQVQKQSAIRTSKAIVKDKLSYDAWIQCTASKPHIQPKDSDSGLGKSLSRSGGTSTDRDSCSVSSAKTSKSKVSHKTGKVKNLQLGLRGYNWEN